jgi:hypothetical protein
MTMKRITIELTDYEWKEISDTLRHELGEPLRDEEIKNIVKKEVERFIRDTYIHSLA